MRTSTPLLAISVILLILIIGGYALSTRTEDTPTPTATTSPTPTQSPPQPGESPASGVYVDYRSGIIEQTSGTKVLFFHAPWCPQCRTLEASIKAGTIPVNTTIIKVDYDSNQALRKTYGVTLQTTLVRVDDAGALVKKFVAYDDPSLEALIQNAL